MVMRMDASSTAVLLEETVCDEPKKPKAVCAVDVADDCKPGDDKCLQWLEGELASQKKEIQQQKSDAQLGVGTVETLGRIGNVIVNVLRAYPVVSMLVCQPDGKRSFSIGRQRPTSHH